MISIPPRHGKSVLISEYLPGWWLGTFPDDRVILGAYGADFAARWGERARDHFLASGYEVFGVKVNENHAAADDWSIAQHEGNMKTVGVLGPITGRGANLFIMDDPIKNDREALSKVYRDHMYEWYRSTAYTRLEPGGRIILAMARWHEDDLAGRLILEMKSGGEEWVILNLPAIAEEGTGPDLLGRTPGQALWPERYNETDLSRIRRATSEFWWNALFQGRPMPIGGAIFKRENFRYYGRSKDSYLLYDVEGGVAEVVPTEGCWLFMTADLAVSTKTRSDYTVICVWAVTPKNDLLLLDMDRQRLEHPDQMDVIKSMHMKYGYRSASIDIESTQYQLALVQEAVRAGLPAVGIRADRDKLARALPAANRMEQHTIYLPTNTWWVDDVEGELLVFTGRQDKHDDIVDNFSLAARRVGMGEGDIQLWTSGGSPIDIGYETALVQRDTP